MNTHDLDLAGAVWRKASYSNGYGGDCVQVAALTGEHRAVRDSKNPTGPALICTVDHWAAFTMAVRADTFD